MINRQILLLLLLFIYLVKQVSIYNGSEMYTDVDLRIKIKIKVKPWYAENHA